MAEAMVLNSVGATVIIDGDERESVTVNAGTTVHWSVSKTGYVTQEGDYTVNGDTVLPVVLKREQFEVTFIVTPANAGLDVEKDGEMVKVTGSGGTYTVTSKYGDVLNWSCSADGYESQAGVVTVEGDATVRIDLVQESVTDPAIWFEKDGVKIDTLSLDCSGDRVVIDVCASADDVMWQVDSDQYGDWGATQLYVTPTSGTGSGKMTIYRDMLDGSVLSAWSVGMMVHYGLTSAYSSGTETLTVERIACEVPYLYWQEHSMYYEYNDYTQQTAMLFSNLGWNITVTGDTSNAPRITETSGSGDCNVGITPSSFPQNPIDDFQVKAAADDGSREDILYVHLFSKNETGIGLSFLDGKEYKVDYLTEGNWEREQELSFRIRAWGVVKKIKFDGQKLWMSDLGGEWGLSSVECDGQTLTADGEFVVEPDTEYTVTVRWHNWFCRNVSELGTPYGVELELEFDAYNNYDKNYLRNEVRIYTTNGGTGPYTP